MKSLGIAVFSFCVLCSLLMVESNIELKPMIKKVNPLKSPEKLTSSQWRKLLRNLKPKIDSHPKGKKMVAETAGKSSHGTHDDSTHDSSISTHIIGGSSATRGQFPWQAAIFAGSAWFCGGSLIDNYWVLTAGHCIGRIKTFTIVLGATNRTINETDIKTVVSKVSFVHPNYSSTTLVNDIALLKLPEAVNTPTFFINVIRLPTISDAQSTFEGTLATVSGWGLTSNVGNVNPMLLWSNVSIIPNTICVKTYGSTTITSSTICTATDGGKIGTCKGDSGGPLIYKEQDGQWTQIGIVSFVSSAGCTYGHPDGFTRVSSFLGWISNCTSLEIRP